MYDEWIININYYSQYKSYLYSLANATTYLLNYNYLNLEEQIRLSEINC